MSNENNGLKETNITELYDQLTDAERLYIIDCMKTMLKTNSAVSKQHKSAVLSDLLVSLQ